jgi:hypothetical protein
MEQLLIQGKTCIDGVSSQGYILVKRTDGFLFTWVKLFAWIDFAVWIWSSLTNL